MMEQWSMPRTKGSRYGYISIQSCNLQNYIYSLFAKVEMTEEWAKKYPKIHFSVMHPGWADTPAVRSVFTPDLL